jgi:hypothetical protein
VTVSQHQAAGPHREILLGSAATAVWACRLMLAHGLHATRDDAEFIYLLVHGVSSTIWWVYVSIWAATAAGSVLGALGGLVAGPGKQPARPQPGLWLTVAAVSLSTSALMFIVNIAVYDLLGPITQRAADKQNLALPYPSESIFNWPVATSLGWLVLWQLIAWLIVRKSPPRRQADFMFVILMAVVLAFIVIPFTQAMILASVGDISIKAILPGIILLALAAGLLWAAVKIRLQPRKSPLTDTHLNRSWNKAREFFQSKGEARVAAWYFLVMELFTILVVFLTDRSAFQLVWLDAGLLSGLIFAILGLRDTWKAPIPPPESPAIPSARRWFEMVSLSGLFPALTSALTSLAALSIVLIPVVLIAVQMLRNEAEAIAAAEGQSLVEIVRMNYMVPISGLIALGLGNLIFALLIAAAGVFFAKLRLAFNPPESAIQKETE